jgi:hypothetical protein
MSVYTELNHIADKIADHAFTNLSPSPMYGFTFMMKRILTEEDFKTIKWAQFRHGHDAVKEWMDSLARSIMQAHTCHDEREQEDYIPNSDRVYFEITLEQRRDLTPTVRA